LDNINKLSILKKTDNPSQNINYEFLFKISLIGDSGIGKTSILLRFIDNVFKEDTTSTIGVDFKIVSISLGDGTYAKMQIWDTCGSERFKSLTASFIKSCPAFLLIFDITKYKSFKNLENWLKIINENTNPKLICLVGNKCDLENERQVPRDEAQKFCEKNNLSYIETSAKTSENIEKVFIQVAQNFYDEVRKKKGGNDKGNLGTFEIGGYKNIYKENHENNENVNNSSCSC
jgi:small GTP-binding protein